MNTPASFPGNPPDHIQIPERLRSRPIASLGRTLGVPRLGKGFASRLRHTLQYAGIRLLGDLDGKRLSDFAEYRGCGKGTVWALRSMILRALRPRVKPDPATWPIPMGNYRPPPPAIEVPHTIRRLSPKHLPASPRLEGVLERLGIRRLGQLHGVPIPGLLAGWACGAKTLAELLTLLRRAEAGEFTCPDEALPPRTPAQALRQIDDLVSRLPVQDRAILKLCFGDTPPTFRKIGQRHALTASGVAMRVSRAIEWVRRQGSRRLRTLLDSVDAAGASSHVPLSPALVSTWQEPSRPFRYSPCFYVRIISRLRPALGVSGRRRTRQAPARTKRA